MKFSTVCQLAFATVAVASDIDILNFALTLEHLERAFYREGLATFSQSDFDAVGYTPRLRFNIGEVSYDEDTHVSVLESVLGSQAVPACEYDFGLTDVKSFMYLAGILEGVGVTAYLGAAHLIQEPAYITAAGSILTIEARHSSYIRDNQLPTQSGFAYPFDVPLTARQVFTLASPLFTSCPPAADLGITALPSMALRPGNRMPTRAGMWNSFKLAKGVKAVQGSTYAYYIGNGGYIPAAVQVPPAAKKGNRVRIQVPDGVAGQSYAILSSAASASDVSDDNILAGPAIVSVQSPYTYMGFPM